MVPASSAVGIAVLSLAVSGCFASVGLCTPLTLSVDRPTLHPTLGVRDAASLMAVFTNCDIEDTSLGLIGPPPVTNRMTATFTWNDTSWGLTTGSVGLAEKLQPVQEGARGPSIPITRLPARKSETLVFVWAGLFDEPGCGTDCAKPSSGVTVAPPGRYILRVTAGSKVGSPDGQDVHAESAIDIQ